MTHGGIASWKMKEGEFVNAGDIMVGRCRLTPD
jgi:pyruvate/2-oxoglutarate dehydrogenase complex dihydrolipoamide acyltransferase (E2) component